MSTRTKSAVCTAIALAGLVLGAPQAAAQAAYPTSHFRVEYGNTYAEGTLTWYNRSVGVTGNVRTYTSSGCRRVYAATYDSVFNRLGFNNTSPKCGDAIRPFEINLSADVAGGAYNTDVCLQNEGAVALKCEAYYRSDAS